MPTSDPEETLNVVILYDTHAAAKRGMMLYTQLAHDLADECRPELSLWRFDMAADPALAPKSSRDIAFADLILVAAHGLQSCPSSFGDGPQQTDQTDPAQHHVLVVLLEVDGQPCPPSCTWIDLVRPTIAQRPANVFVWEGRKKEQPASPLDFPGLASHNPAGGEREPVAAAVGLVATSSSWP